MTFGRRTVLALVAGALLVAGCGDENNNADISSAASGNSVDRAFVRQMIRHHQSAVQMAQIAQRRGPSTFDKRLANDILRTQTAEISTLRAADRRLEAAGVTAGSLDVPERTWTTTQPPEDRQPVWPHTPEDDRSPRGRDRDGESRAREGKDPQLNTLVQKIISAQQREISQMRKHLDGGGAAGMTRPIDDTAAANTPVKAATAHGAAGATPGAERSRRSPARVQPTARPRPPDSDPRGVRPLQGLRS
jgi:hypothetical protein